jgi:hypothetical protein
MTRVPFVLTVGMGTLVVACAAQPGALGAAGLRARQASVERAAKSMTLRIDCTEAALRGAFDKVAAAGAGTITFNCANATIGMNLENNIVFRGNDLVLDGEQRNITLRYTGPQACDQTEGQNRLEIFGDRNTIRNLTIHGFPDGIHFQEGDGNVADNLRFPVICEDAITTGGRGFVATNTVVRQSYFQGATDKAIMLSHGSTVTIDGSEFVNCQQPIRNGGASGRAVVRNSIFRGTSSGVRFDGGAQGWSLLFDGNSMSDASFGVRVYGDAQAIIRRNTFRRGTRTGRALGVSVFDRGRARLADNTMTGYDNAADSHAVLIQDTAQVDLGGGRVEIDDTSDSSPGRNTFRNGRRGAPYDVRNDSSNLVMAERNRWDHSAVDEIEQHDVFGRVDVDPPNGEPRL